MNDATPRSLAEIHRRGTRYEVAARHPFTGRSVVVGFTARRSRAGLLDLLRTRSDSFLLMIGEENAEAPVEKVTSPGVVGFLFGSWVVQFTGHTEREVALMNAGAGS